MIKIRFNRKTLDKNIIKKYRKIEKVVYGYNLDENVYDKYQKIVRIVADEKNK